MVSSIAESDTVMDTDERPTTDNSAVLDALRRRARRKGQSLTWNRNTLLATYAVLTATIVLALRVQNEWVIAPASVLGLVLIWAFNYLQVKKLHAENFEEEVREYETLLSRRSTEPKRDEPVVQPVARVKSPLSDREAEVLNEIATGKSNKQAAIDLYISEQTVKNHIKHIFTKLDVGDRTSAILLGVRNGWIDSDSVGRWRKSWADAEFHESHAR